MRILLRFSSFLLTTLEFFDNLIAMKSRRIYITSVVTLFIICVAVFLIDYLPFFENYYGLDPLGRTSTGDYHSYQDNMKPAQQILSVLFLGSLIGIMVCSVKALDHTVTLRISARVILTIACLATLLFLFTIVRGAFQ